MEKNAIEQICQDLNLPLGDKFTQDWIFELPEQYRTFDYFKKYFDAYLFRIYAFDEKKLLLNIMMDVVNDLLECKEAKGKLAWNGLSYVLWKDALLFKDTIDYWAQWGQPLDNVFTLTPYVRSINQEDISK